MQAEAMRRLLAGLLHKVILAPSNCLTPDHDCQAGWPPQAAQASQDPRMHCHTVTCAFRDEPSAQQLPDPDHDRHAGRAPKAAQASFENLLHVAR